MLAKALFFEQMIQVASTGPHTPRISGQDGTNMEASTVHRSARDAPAVASPELQALVEIQVQSHVHHTQDLR